ncbi:vesicular glutamate transporter 3-like [Planococcus citri]|uniref:vesicular glutamate transporter 3-like n=1 Tax=Planococcus citri TaxID=170843 RepID=UPI0031F78462
MELEENHIEGQKTTSQLLESDTNDTKQIPDTPPLLISKRFLVAIVLFFCYIVFQILRNNMSIAIVDMIANKSLSNDPNATQFGPEFDWDSKTVALVNSIISYGSLFSFMSGFIVDKLGGSVTCSLCMFLSGILTILHSAALEQNFYIFLACRFLTGLFESSFYVSTTYISSRWFPKRERTTLISFAFNGTNFGVAVTYPFCGYLAKRWGWRMVFYVTGVIALFVALLVQILVRNHPSQDTWITKKELAYILEDTDDIDSPKMEHKDSKKDKHVLKYMLTSGPLWALYGGTFCFMWMSTILGACLPLYINDVTKKEVDEIGYLSSVPNAVYIFMFPILGALIDYWKNHSDISMTRIHKILLSSAFISASLLFTAAVFISDYTTSMILFITIQVFLSVAPLVFSLIIVNIAPKHTSHVGGLCSIFFSSGAFVALIVTGFIVTNHTIQEWNNTFLLTAGVSIVGALIFVLYGSSEAQKWSL